MCGADHHKDCVKHCTYGAVTSYYYSLTGMALQNSQREIQEAGLRTPYTFTSNKGGIKLAYCGYSYVKDVYSLLDVSVGFDVSFFLSSLFDDRSVFSTRPI